jgi:hypothetical protein
VPPEVAWPPDTPTGGVVFSRLLADEFAFADPDERFELLMTSSSTAYPAG